MSKNSISFCVALFFCCMLISCKKQTPQLPSNKGIVADQNVVALLEINQDLALKEDSVLEQFVQKTNKALKKHEIGFWYIIDQKADGPSLKDQETCRFSCRIMSLDGKVIEEEEKTAVIGKKQLVMGLEEGLKLLHKGESATFIIPWYLAYGMKGNEPLIDPYTSLIYKIKLYK